jgi:hypothetical protein
MRLRLGNKALTLLFANSSTHDATLHFTHVTSLPLAHALSLAIYPNQERPHRQQFFPSTSSF